MNPELLQLLMPVGTAVGVYAAIRADIAYMRAKIEHAHEDARLAHKRLDAMGVK